MISVEVSLKIKKLRLVHKKKVTRNKKVIRKRKAIRKKKVLSKKNPNQEIIRQLLLIWKLSSEKSISAFVSI